MSGESVTFPTGNPLGDGQGVMFGDPDKTKKALIVVHEWWGNTQQIQDQGAEIAKRGDLVVLVADMYRGKVATDHETAGHYMGDMNWDGAMQDLSGAAKFLKSRGCSKVGICGFCMGGALCFAAAASIPEDISAAAPFYGIPDQSKFDLTKIKIPVQAHFGEKDSLEGFSSKSAYEPLREKLTAAGVNLEFFTYDAGHAFVNPENRIGPNYNEALANLAFGRMFDFMGKNLA